MFNFPRLIRLFFFPVTLMFWSFIFIEVQLVSADSPIKNHSLPINAYTTSQIPIITGTLGTIDPSNQTVIFWHNQHGSREELLRQLITQFNNQNPYNISVSGIDQGNLSDIRDKIDYVSTSGDLPNLTIGYQSDSAHYYADLQIAQDLTPYVNDEQWGLTPSEKNDYSTFILDSEIHPEYGGKQLAFPYQRVMYVLFYNKTWMTELGVDVPPSFTPQKIEDIACAAIRNRNDGKGGLILDFSASNFAATVMARGGNVLSDSGLCYTYNTPASTAYLTQLKRMYDNGCAWQSPQKYHDYEFAQRDAILYTASSKDAYFVQNSMTAFNNSDEWGIAPIPYTTTSPVIDTYGTSLIMLKNTPEQQLATWVFIKWLIEPEQQAFWIENNHFIPIRYSTATYLADYFLLHPQYTQIPNWLQYSDFEPPLI